MQIINPAPDSDDQPTAKLPEATRERLMSILDIGSSEQIAEMSAAGACLAPLLSVLGWTGEPRHLQEALPYIDNVENVDGLRTVLARLNYETYGQKRSMRSLGGELLPCLYQSKDGSLYIVISIDPDGQFHVFDGQAKENRSIFPDETPGIAYFIRTINVEEQNQSGKQYGWIQSLLARFRRTFFILFGLTFSINVLALLVPLYVMSVYDRVIGAKSIMTLAYFLAGILIVIAADQILRALRSHYIAYLGARIENLVITGAFRQLLHLPLPVTETAPIGAQITRLKQFESVREVFTGTLASTILDLPFFFVFIATILLIGGYLGVVPVALMCIYLLMAAITVPLTSLRVREAGEAKLQSRNFLVELVTKRDAIRSCGAEAVWSERFRDIAGRVLYRQFVAQQLTMTIQTLSQALLVIAGTATAGFGALMVIDGDLSVGALIAVMALVWRILSPLQSAFLSLNRISQTTRSFKQINVLMRMATERQSGQLPTFYRKFKGKITFQQVSFRHSPNVEPALRGISLQINPKKFVAITGAGGVGKSTLLKIISHLYEPQAGMVRIDDLDLRQIDVGELRHAIAYVPQRASFFYGTIAQNLQLAHPAATRQDMIAALEDIGALKTVDKLEDGLDTRLVGNTNVRFTDGFLQQLLLAQAFIKKTSIYLMDEPGKNLDKKGDEALIEALKRLRGHATIVMVTQRPSHMQLADEIVVLDHGCIAAQGTPEEILPKLLKHQNQPVKTKS